MPLAGYDTWKTTLPDDDPYGEAYDHDDDRCPSCGASSVERCHPDCGCAYCLRLREAEREQGAE